MLLPWISLNELVITYDVLSMSVHFCVSKKASVYYIVSQVNLERLQHLENALARVSSFVI